MCDIEVRKIPVKEFNDFFINSPDVILDHLKDSYVRSNKALKRMTYAVASSAYYRLLFELINECSFIKPKKDGSYQLNLHSYEIAECAGLSRETASRQFHKLKDLKLVKISRKYITVKDLNRLKRELSTHI
jgi:CRP-like cAMP-binding protein